ncbi:hypothetical protein JCM19274_4200 [Algibacter lectus]|uniref:Uncharacterized protein n=1 Tax=Algibacter lectus TaxID=221126 RepID=A0A090WPT0_9FLAO|nr:hypothetical protein JCM19274_4200 [Algibacter lectus]
MWLVVLLFLLAKKSLKNGQHKVTSLWLLVTLVLGVVFIYNQFAGFRQIIDLGV